MALGFFCDKHILPSEEEVKGILGKAAEVWEKLKGYIQEYGLIKEEWKIYSQKAGWCKKILITTGKEERNIIFLYPNVEHFTGILVFGKKAVQDAQNSGIPDEILCKILKAKEYKEGRSFDVEIRGKRDFEIIKKLIDIKIHN
ncbi:UNVERIFIED_CONTAM: uncharacterized protein DUF3788 [Acetivibrio alkalicellulosi]